MEKKIKVDECIENLWNMKEKGQSALNDLKTAMGDEFNSSLIENLLHDGMVMVTDDGVEITLTEDGEACGRRLIRSHRLAERLVYDVLGGDFEAGACEFEHIANPGLVNSICTLLGHPRECPHGMPIPTGSCCRSSLRTAESSVMRLTEMSVGQTARIAYINCRDDKRLHKLESLHIRPGTTVKLHQNSPTTVIECEGASIAIDESVCADICLWKNEPARKTHETQNISMERAYTQKKGTLSSLGFLKKFKTGGV
ncbi:Magnetosome protein involved in iron transport into magnetosomes Mad30-2 [Candidatus Desulfarcum epimagneticum]|uniref:Magnetosome protein involved in iron transport into magnetosomes Mad30-2 n=1 Tax=uncultured Desulfobacteraceae bacterium TaxID=218296 RepID=A0A484HK77_9BACT|nr:Magnetosome protein involved in iron transport into magnetosomes Mad30-2 [uncultured Desulfobacteraceae bacterium]